VKRLNEADIASASTDGQAAIRLVQQAIERPGGLTFDGIRELRTRINDRLSYDLGEHSVSQRALKALKAGLDEDLRFAVQRAGVAKKGSNGAAAREAFDRANRQASEIFQRRGELERIIGRDGTASPESIAERLLTMASAGRGGDVQRLAQVQSIVGGDAWRDLAGAALRQMGRTPDGLSASRLRTAWEGLSPNGRDILFGRGQLRQRLDALMGTAERTGQLQEALRGGSQGALEDALGPSATAISAMRKQLQKVLGADAMATPEAIVDRLATLATAKAGAGIGRLGQIKLTVSKEAWGELASAVLRQMGRTKDGLSIAALRTAYGNLSAEGRALLFGTGEWRRSLDKIMSVAQQFEFLQRAGNPSGTAKALFTVEAIPLAIAHPFAVLGGIVGNRGFAELLAKPIPAAQLARWVQAYAGAAAKPNPAQLTLLGQASRALAQAAASQGMVPQHVQAGLDDAARQLAQAGGTRADSGQARATARPDLEGNVTYQAMLTKGVHPRNAEMAISSRNPDLIIKMLRNSERFREPGTPAERLLEMRRGMGVAGGVY
jgi:hypothetical protein